MNSQKNIRELVAGIGMDIPQEPVCPRIESDDQVKQMLEKNYGLTAVLLKSLNGYDDKNYHAMVNAEHTNPHIDTVWHNGYLVKIVNHLDSKMPEFQMGQKLLMDRLTANGIPSQTELKTVSGKFFPTLIANGKDGEEVTHMVSVRSYLSGDILDNVTLTPSLAHDVGSLTAGIYQGLRDVEFQFYNDFTPLWNMDNLWKVKKVQHAVTDPDRIRVVEEVFEAFESVVVPSKEEFRKGMIHGDINEQNILVEESASGIAVCGVIDFQDSCKSCCVYDLSIAVAYMMMVSKTSVPLMDVGGHMLAGYYKTAQLNDAERKSLKTLVASRMVMSLVYGAYFYMLNPSNEYFLATSKAGWNNLLEFWKTEESSMWDRWNQVIESYAKP